MAETKNTFVQRQKDELVATLNALRKHAETMEERIIQEPDDDALRDYLEDAEEGIEALEPMLADFEREGVDPEELIGYAQTLEEWQEKEKEIGEYLQK